MASETRLLELVHFGNDCGYPVYWIVNWSDDGIRTLTFWAGSVGWGEHCRRQASGIPPRSRLKIIGTLFVEPGPQICAVEEIVWEDGTMESCFHIPLTDDEMHARNGEEFAKLIETNVAVTDLDEHEIKAEVWNGLWKTMGWARR